MKRFLRRVLSILKIEVLILRLVAREVFCGRGMGLFKFLSHEHLKVLQLFLARLSTYTRFYSRTDFSKFAEMAKRARDSHERLQRKLPLKFSILIPTHQVKENFFRQALESALNQSAPSLEVLVGFDGPPAPGLEKIIAELTLDNPRASAVLKVFHFERSLGGGISRTTNSLAEKAQGDFFILLDHDDWIRPDLTLRYHQSLFLSSNPQVQVLYCDEYKINSRGEKILDSEFYKSDDPPFPYLFINSICHCLCLASSMWKQVGGLRAECDGAQDFDLCLRLHSAGANFFRVPAMLYAWRAHSASTAGPATAKDYATAAGLRALQDFADTQKLKWKVEVGFGPTQYRARPEPCPQKVLAIIPFRDQAALTLACVQELKKQTFKGELSICAVNNQSRDASLLEALRSEAVEILEFNEPFNFSAMNNFAVANSMYAGRAEVLLFLNNDVELAAGALEELVAWVDQPGIGAIGPRLLYPNGRLQHGGILRDLKLPAESLNYIHMDLGLRPEDCQMSRVLYVPDALTGACLLMKKSIFSELGGFDEELYPTTYSDVALCAKLKTKLNLRCLYTPFAQGIHYESASRGKEVLEDFEFSKKILDLQLSAR